VRLGLLQKGDLNRTPEEDAAWQTALEAISETMVAGGARRDGLVDPREDFGDLERMLKDFGEVGVLFEAS
jgi:hypothetical protein